MLPFPKKQHPPPLVVPLEPHQTIHQAELIRNVIVIHLKIVVIAQIPSQELVGDRSLQGSAVDLLLDHCPCHSLVAVGYHVERFLVVA